MSEPIQYFPPAWFDEDEKEQAFTATWYSSHLSAMQEPSLWLSSKDQQQHTYRFLWLRTFHHPIAVRLLIANEGQGEIVLKVTDGMGGYEPGDLIVKQSRPLSKEKVAVFLKKLQSLNFWELPVSVNRLGCDGAEWILEGIRDGKYHLVERWSPEKDEFSETALALLGLSNLIVENIY